MSNPNLTEVSKPTQWKPGQSGNLNGRPVGSRTAFSNGFLTDLAQVWQEQGKDTMIHTAKTQPAVFFATCARLIGPEVKLTIEQSQPGLDAADIEILRAIKQAIPDAAECHLNRCSGMSWIAFKRTSLCCLGPALNLALIAAVSVQLWDCLSKSIT